LTSAPVSVVAIEAAIILAVLLLSAPFSYFGLGRRGRALHAVERMTCLFILTMLSPLMIVICLCIKIVKGGRLFSINQVEEEGRAYRKILFQTAKYGSPDDDVVSRHLRRLSLDQLPWLMNVVKGDTHLPKFTDAFMIRRTPKQQLADLCGADNPQHLFNALVENRRGRLGRLHAKDQAVVHRFMVLTGAVFVTGGDPLDDDWDDGDDWSFDMDPFEFELLQYDELIKDLDDTPVSQIELATAKRLMPLMKTLHASTYEEARLRSRAEMGPGVGKHRNRCDGWDRSHCRAGTGARERGARGCKPVRVRGSRRLTRNSQGGGGGSGGDDPPGGEPEPALDRLVEARGGLCA
jgi:hypothetical protein